MHYWTGNVARGPSRICMSGRGLYFFLAITWQVWDVHVKIKMLRNVIIVCALIEIDMCTCDVCVRAKFIYTVHHFCVCVCARVWEREGERRLKWVSAYFHFHFASIWEQSIATLIGVLTKQTGFSFPSELSEQHEKEQKTKGLLLSKSYFQMDTSDTRKQSDNRWMEGWMDELLGSWLIFIHLKKKKKKKTVNTSLTLKTFIWCSVLGPFS